MDWCEDLLNKLKKLSKRGVVLLFDGKPETPKSLAAKLKRNRNNCEPVFSYSSDGDLSILDYIIVA